jgi:hypothetical protein
MTDTPARGKAVEKVLNRLFHSHGILVREDFKVYVESGSTQAEQVDGAIELDGLFLVEMKWEAGALDVNHISRHLVRTMSRAGARGGMMISANSYGAPAVAMCKEFLAQKLMVLIDLRLILKVLETEDDLGAVLRHVINAVILDKEPYYRG